MIKWEWHGKCCNCEFLSRNMNDVILGAKWSEDKESKEIPWGALRDWITRVVELEADLGDGSRI